jgi:tetratricopeptide (TPR) repeat protein
LGNYYRNLQDWSGAEEALRKAAHYQPDLTPALLALGAVLERLEQGEAATELYQQAIAIAPTQVGGYISLANLLMKQGDFDAAEETLRRARTMDPTSIAVYQTLGSLKTQMGEEQEAMQLYQQALEELPGVAKFYVLQGNILEEQVTRAGKQVEIAKAALRKALFYFDLIRARLKPRNPVYRLKENDVFVAKNNLEYAEMVYQQELSKLDQAQALYRQALMLDPANQDALLGLARIAAEEGDEEEALAYYRRTVALNPTSVSGWMTLGNYYLELERPDEAIESFQAVLDLAPHFLGSQLGLVRAFRLLDAQQFDVLRAEKAAQYGSFLFQFTARRFRIRQLKELGGGS